LYFNFYLLHLNNKTFEGTLTKHIDVIIIDEPRVFQTQVSQSHHSMLLSMRSAPGNEMQDIAGVSIGTAVSAAAAAAASSSVSRVGCLPASCFWDFFIGASADFSRCLPNCVVAIGPQHVTITSFTSFGAWAKFWLTLVPTAKRCGFGAIPRVTHNAVDIIIFSRTV
jgi:hypothetical protein